MLLAQRIKTIRKIKLKTQEQISLKLGISQPAYSQYEREASNCTFTTIVKIAEALECSIPFLTDIHSKIYDEKEWYESIVAKASSANVS
jgi:transcriptional regulator with XRE-family HTH domain